MASCGILQVELYKDGNQVDAMHMVLAEVAQMGDQAIHEILTRASTAVAPKQVKCLTYDDDEGDSCTLTKDTLPDALSFAVPLDDSISVLQFHVKCALEAPVEPPVKSETEAPAITETFEAAAALAALNKLAQGLDLRHLVPKFAEVALDLVATIEEPALFEIIDLLIAFREGTRNAHELPDALPEIIAVVCSLPESTRLSVLAQAKVAMEKVVEEAREKAHENVAIEVHPHVACDGCDCCPIVGPRYKSLEQDDFDLCATCFGREARQPTAWVQVKSDVRADVVSSYYASPGQSPVHHGIVCDGCNMHPIVGQRFKERGENFDLCSSCMETFQASPHAGTRTFEEIVVTTASKLVATEEERLGNEMNREASAPVPSTEVPSDVTSAVVEKGEDSLQNLAENECRKAMMALLQHSNADVRAAAKEALDAVKGIVVESAPFVPPPRDVLNYDIFPVDQVKDEVEEPSIDPEIKEKPKISAKVLNSADLTLGIEAYEDATARGDVTSQLAEIVESCGATHAYNIGRVVLSPVEDVTVKVPVCAKIVVVNDGDVAWPETAAISIACGPDYEFPHMNLGALQVGEAAEVIMDLAVPASTPKPSRSAWAIIDAANGVLLGPMLCFEVVHE